ncbi:MAG: DNA gyrase subunit A [Chloroflexi bacterium ADurb.Bin325]|nr:MAG: DNA gyrase subunit A [Chloroflexi bacterium ADurb.Bin325]
MEPGIIRPVNIDAEMQASYLDYAMSVIVARALPDARDGLKPVHRRILWAMYDLGLLPDKPYKKSARIVGEVLGKYHPHGDAAVYEAMVRMAQNFSLRYPLVDGQGNFGSIDGDNAAAMRYTEARLAPIALEMLADIEKDTVDWSDNFDGSLKEPSVLPAALPNLLVNGSSGIAVGMSTNIPPHNLGEVCDALCYLIENYQRHEDVTVEDLMRFIPGPDFPTGGVVYRYSHLGAGEDADREDAIAKAYAGGKGSIVMQAKAHIEEMSRSKARIVVTELPYQTNKSSLIERIAELVRDGRIEGVTDLRDESDRTGMRIIIELTRTVDPNHVLGQLFKLTPLQQTFGVSLLALVDGEPRLLSLKRALLHFIEHRQNVIVRRARYDLARAKERAHIVEGLLRALDMLDAVIALIRGSRTAEMAREGLVKQLGFTSIQAQAILDMQLRRLAALERRKLETEHKELLALIKELEELLKSPKKVLDVIRQDLKALKNKYGDARRTQIADRAKGVLTTIDLLPQEELWLTLNTDGVLARSRGEKPAFPLLPVQFAVKGDTKTDLYLLTARGQAGRVQAHQIPETGGGHFTNLTGLPRGSKIAALLALPKPDGEPLSSYIVLATEQGKVKRINAADLAASIGANPQVIGLDEGDRLVWAGVSQGDGEVLLFTARGQAIRFGEEDVRAMGLPAGGIGGIRLAADDRVIAGATVAGDAAAAQVALVLGAGYAKRVPLADFPAQGRNGKGISTAKLSSRSGDVVYGALAGPEDRLVCVQAEQAAVGCPVAGLAQMGRASSGKALAGLVAGLSVTRVYALAGAGGPDGAAQKRPARSAKAAAEKAAPAAEKAPRRAASPAAAAAAPKPARKAAAAPAEKLTPTGKAAAGKAAASSKATVADKTAPVGKAAATDKPAAARKAAATQEPEKPPARRGRSVPLDAAQLALLATIPPPEAADKPKRAARKPAADPKKPPASSVKPTRGPKK